MRPAIQRAVILAAGKGRRLYPMTKAIPKPMLPVYDRPAIQTLVDELRKVGIEEIGVVAHYKKDVICDYFYGEKDVFVLDQNGSGGTAEALLCARDFLKEEPFVLLYGDTLVNTRENNPLFLLLTQYRTTESVGVLGLEKPPKDMHKHYNTVTLDEHNQIHDIIEKQAHPTSPWSAYGYFVLSPLIFSYLSSLSPNVHNERCLTDALQMLAKNHVVLGQVTTEKRFDIGTVSGWQSANHWFYESNKKEKG